MAHVRWNEDEIRQFTWDGVRTRWSLWGDHHGHDYARAADGDSPWARQKWVDSAPPEFGPFVMAREPNKQRKITWTWKLRDAEVEGRSRYLTSLV